MRVFFIFFGIIFSVLYTNAQSYEKSELGRFIIKGHRYPPDYRSDCEYRFAAILAKTNSQNIISDISFKNELPEKFKRSFQYLIGYQFSKENHFTNTSILIFITYDKIDICYPNTLSVLKVDQILEDWLRTIADQLKEDPKTHIISKPIQIKVYQSSHPYPRRN